jgi:uncharacterized protein
MRDPGGWIGTFSGTKFWPLEPRYEEISIEDIAHSLSRQCRFNGHCGPFYSVAEHSIEVSRAIPIKLLHWEEVALWGLMHDAAEAYLSDIVRPIKGRSFYYFSPRGMECGRFKTYHQCEGDLLYEVAKRFGLTMPIPREVDEADERMLATERQQLFDGRQPDWDCLAGVEPYPIVLRCMDPGLAEELFIARFRELINAPLNPRATNG